MKINKICIDGYKNLKKCEISPSRLHAITGVNGSGKSNLLEIFQFISTLITRDDSFRHDVLVMGVSPSGSPWFPVPVDDKKQELPSFSFYIECEINVKDVSWVVSYSLQIAGATVGEQGRYYLIGPGVINGEEVTIKQFGKPGPAKVILSRSSEGEVSAHLELGVRKKVSFKTKKDMSSIQALEVREADDFDQNYPVLNQFKRGLLSSAIVKLNLTEMLKISDFSHDYKLRERSPGTAVSSFSLYDSIESIKKDEGDWREYLHWLKTLCHIDSITVRKNKVEDSKVGEHKITLIRRENQILLPNELSTGNMILLSLVTALFSFLRDCGVVVFEEPETYIHPQALVDLIKLLRTVSDEKTVLFSTHSPVALNSLQACEVTLMKSCESGRYTAIHVEDIEEASSALSRGYLSFGDLLQSNFMTDNNE